MRRLILFFTLLTLLTAGLPGTAEAATGSQLLRSAERGTVYYVDADGIRHPFPNLTAYQSWYANDFSAVTTVADKALTDYPLGRNITIRPGTYLVKIQTSPTVYAVEFGGVLRAIQDPAIATEIFGSQWSGRVVDVPDVFFDNYTVGAPINRVDQIPDGSVLRRSATSEHPYYFMERGILQPFSSAAAVVANGYRLADALTTDRPFYTRTRPISGFDATVFNPIALALNETSDCANKKLKAAVVFIAKNETSNAELAKLAQLQQLIPAQFAWATDGLATIDTSYPIVVLSADSATTRLEQDGTTAVLTEAVNTFYETEPDEFDFLVVWTNFTVPFEEHDELATFTSVTNRQRGSGRGLQSAAEVYGSGGKLKGVITMGDLGRYDLSTTSGKNEAMHWVLHELGHQWAAFIKFVDADSTERADLLRADGMHWSHYVSFMSPLGGAGWRNNGDGTFTSALSELPAGSLRPYSQLDLYLMGLIPKQFVDPVFYIVPDLPNATGNTITGVAQQVTIEQIIQGSGEISCTVE